MALVTREKLVARPQRPATAGHIVSVLICAYTEARWDALVLAVRSAAAQGPEEVVVVVDHNDALLARARHELPEARVIANAGPRGLSGARNTGIAAAADNAEIVVFLDDDACPRPGWLERIGAAFADESVIAAGGTALPRYEGAVPGWLPDEFLWVVGCSYRGLPVRVAEIRNPIGANMAFRRDVLARTGGFTDGIGRIGKTPLGCEETELAIRARGLTGGRVLQIPGAAVDHLVTAERCTFTYFRRRCWAEGLSKALVAASVGAEQALDSERRYVIRVLPTGVLRGIADALRGDLAGLARAGAIVAGLALTAAGYLRGKYGRE